MKSDVTRLLDNAIIYPYIVEEGVNAYLKDDMEDNPYAQTEEFSDLWKLGLILGATVQAARGE